MHIILSILLAIYYWLNKLLMIQCERFIEGSLIFLYLKYMVYFKKLIEWP